MTGNGFQRLLWLFLLLALFMRLLFAIQQSAVSEYRNAKGGDSGWYLAVGAGFFQDAPHGTIRGVDYYNSVIPTPPLYIMFVGFMQQLLPDRQSILAIRLLQCLASVATVYLAFRTALVLSGDQKTSLIAAAMLAFHPAMIIEPANIATETVYIFFLSLGIWLYVEQINGPTGERPPFRLAPASSLALAALAFGLATLTRAVSIMFPFLLGAHILWLGRRRLIADSKKMCLLFLFVYVSFSATWTLHNLALWNRLVIVSDQLMPAIWRGVESHDGSPTKNDALLLDGSAPDVAEGCQIDCKYQHPTELYLRRIMTVVTADLPGLLVRRASELLYSLLQPYGTTDFGDVSIKAAAREWLGNDRTPHGLLALFRIEGFAIKLATWLFHYLLLALGALGIFWTRRQTIRTAPLTGLALYTLGAHLILLALPRYIFPLEVVWAIFASLAVDRLLKRWADRQNRARW